jgi:hypothetical protein
MSQLTPVVVVEVQEQPRIPEIRQCEQLATRDGRAERTRAGVILTDAGLVGAAAPRRGGKAAAQRGGIYGLWHQNHVPKAQAALPIG